MENRAYWLCLFNATTWPEFLEAGGDTVGYPHSQHKMVFRIQTGDIILAYMTKVSRWIAAMEVTSDPYFDTETQIWKQALFPCRLKVKIQHQLPPGDGVPVLSLAPQLKLFDNLKSPAHWGIIFRSAPREIPESDGQIIIQAIQNAQPSS
ncbi:MAG: EVE domain-containing protein [Cyanobacteria bacterium P01_F01_bin.56]